MSVSHCTKRIVCQLYFDGDENLENNIWSCILMQFTHINCWLDFLEISHLHRSFQCRPTRNVQTRREFKRCVGRDRQCGLRLGRGRAPGPLRWSYSARRTVRVAAASESAQVYAARFDEAERPHRHEHGALVQPLVR